MKIYTKSGDKGETSLVYGSRVSKASVRVEAYGTCDEINSYIGLALAQLEERDEYNEVRNQLQIVQTKLFYVGAELSTPEGKKVGWPLKDEDVEELEKAIDLFDAKLPPLTNFILPGGTVVGATLHVARTVARRAERKAVLVIQQEELNPAVVKYLNRLSDYLFVAARYVNLIAGKQEPGLIT